MKRRMKVSTLLGRVFAKELHTKVIIKGRESGLVLYDGPLLYVPYLHCTDYVFSYKHAPGLLEIVTTAQSIDGIL